MLSIRKSIVIGWFVIITEHLRVVAQDVMVVSTEPELLEEEELDSLDIETGEVREDERRGRGGASGAPPPRDAGTAGGMMGGPPADGGMGGGMMGGPGGMMGGGGGMGGSCSGVCGDCLPSKFETTTNGNTRIVRTNGIPNHNYHHARDQVNPNQVCEKPMEYSFPANPVVASSFSNTPMGPVGIMFTGAVLFNHLSNPTGSNDVAYVHEGPSLDQCHGHAAPDCSYHYHAWNPSDSCDLTCAFSSCEHLGWMFDGFEVVSQCGTAGSSSTPPLKSCYHKVNDSDNDNGGDTTDYTFTANYDGCHLDEANGFDFTGKGYADADGNELSGYKYVMSSQYPFVPIKYRGSTAQLSSTSYTGTIASNENNLSCQDPNRVHSSCESTTTENPFATTPTGNMQGGMPPQDSSGSMQGGMPPQGGSGSMQGGMPPQGGSGNIQSGMPPQGGSGNMQGGMPPQGSSGNMQSGMPPQGSSSNMQSGMPPQGGSGSMQGGMPPQGGSGNMQGAMPPQGGSGNMQGGMPPQDGSGSIQGGMRPQDGSSNMQGGMPPQGGSTQGSMTQPGAPVNSEPNYNGQDMRDRVEEQFGASVSSQNSARRTVRGELQAAVQIPDEVREEDLIQDERVVGLFQRGIATGLGIEEDRVRINSIRFSRRSLRGRMLAERQLSVDYEVVVEPTASSGASEAAQYNEIEQTARQIESRAKDSSFTNTVKDDLDNRMVSTLGSEYRVTDVDSTSVETSYQENFYFENDAMMNYGYNDNSEQYGSGSFYFSDRPEDDGTNAGVTEEEDESEIATWLLVVLILALAYVPIRVFVAWCDGAAEADDVQDFSDPENLARQAKKDSPDYASRKYGGNPPTSLRHNMYFPPGETKKPTAANRAGGKGSWDRRGSDNSLGSLSTASSYKSGVSPVEVDENIESRYTEKVRAARKSGQNKKKQTSAYHGDAPSGYSSSQTKQDDRLSYVQRLYEQEKQKEKAKSAFPGGLPVVQGRPVLSETGNHYLGALGRSEQIPVKTPRSHRKVNKEANTQFGNYSKRNPL